MSLDTNALRVLRASGKRLSKRNYKAACVAVSRPTPSIWFVGVSVGPSGKRIAVFRQQYWASFGDMAQAFSSGRSWSKMELPSGLFRCDLPSLELRIRNGLRCGADVSQDRKALKALKSAIRKSKEVSS